MAIQVDSFKRVKEHLKDNFQPDPRTNLTLVIVLEEETESATVLKMMHQLQKEQEQQASKMPLYERAVLWKNTGVEQLNFH